jgi:hypothetical protein
VEKPEGKRTLGRSRHRWEDNIKWMKGKVVPLQAWVGPEGSRKLRLPDMTQVAFLSLSVCSVEVNEFFCPCLLVLVIGESNS